MVDDVEFDPAKDAINRRKHGLSFADFAGFDGTPVFVDDVRPDYDEARYRAYGRIDGKGYMIAFTRRGTRTRLISYRRVHEKEMRRYETSKD